MNRNLEKNILMQLQHYALNLRIDSLRATTASASGHPTSCLSAADIVATLFFHSMRYKKNDPHFYNNDRFILSKGHAIPVVYAALKNLGVISDEKLLTLRAFSSELEGHPTPRFIYNEAATGSLGQGLSIGLGMALNAKMDRLTYRTYVMMGDGEIAEGSNWEAAELASVLKLNNLIGILDCNRFGQSGESINDHHEKIYAAKFASFGWHTIVINGHEIEEIARAFQEAHSAREKPVIIIAKTFKGYGLENIENKNGFHGKPLKEEELALAIDSLRKRFKEHALLKEQGEYIPQEPQAIASNNNKAVGQEKISLSLETDRNNAFFKKGSLLSTRKAYGYALVALGRASDRIIALDADVKNSTFSEMFEKEFPNRFVECFVAEQNMVSIASGLQLRGKIPFASTFGAFFSRAFDQIRMAGIGRNALRLCGSHCGVSIGEDGPSQMALEDIAMIRTIPSSVVLYPSDGVSTYKLMQEVANYNDGVSYLRTTRAETENIYDSTASFHIGGCTVLRSSKSDVACLIGAGITLHESLKAYELLKKDGIFVSVIDLYSIKPLDSTTVISTAQQSGSKIIAIEDHYEAGGVSEALRSACSAHYTISITSLCVRKLARSGKPAELLSYEEIDSTHIVKTVKSLLS